MTSAASSVRSANPDVFAAISDPTRRRLLDLLGAGPLPVNELARPFPVSRPAISLHLRILREAGLVTARRSGREQHYHLKARKLRDVYDWVAHYERFWKRRLSSLGTYLDRQADEQELKTRGRP